MGFDRSKLAEGESITDVCISLLLNKNLPSELEETIPANVEGIRIVKQISAPFEQQLTQPFRQQDADAIHVGSDEEWDDDQHQ